MVTVTHIVEKIIRQKPYLEQALGRGIVNNAALAEEITPQIEKELRKKVKFSAVNMAIRRLSEKLEKKVEDKPALTRRYDILMRSDLIEFTVYKIRELPKYIKRLYDIVNLREGDFITITQGMNEVMIITNDRYDKKISSLFPEKSIKKTIKGLCSVTVNIPLKAVESVGLFYSITRALAWENINIVDIVSTLTELTFILNEEDGARAFDALRMMVKGN